MTIFEYTKYFFILNAPVRAILKVGCFLSDRILGPTYTCAETRIENYNEKKVLEMLQPSTTQIPSNNYSAPIAKERNHK